MILPASRCVATTIVSQYLPVDPVLHPQSVHLQQLHTAYHSCIATRQISSLGTNAQRVAEHACIIVATFNAAISVATLKASILVYWQCNTCNLSVSGLMRFKAGFQSHDVTVTSPAPTLDDYDVVHALPKMSHLSSLAALLLTCC